MCSHLCLLVRPFGFSFLIVRDVNLVLPIPFWSKVVLVSYNWTISSS